MEEKKSVKISLSTVLLLIAILVIIVMALYIYTEKINSNKEIADLEANATNMQDKIDELQGKIDSISNTINSNDENTSVTYRNLTEEIYNQISENEYFVIQNVIQNTDSTITLKGRIYEDVELTAISESEYNSLKSSGYITLFGENFLLDKYEDFVPGYILKNSNGYGFYVTDNYELVDFNDTNFVKGTDEYYMITLNKTVEFINNMSGEAEKVSLSSFETFNDYDFINNGYIYDFEFNNGKVSKITFNKF